MVLDFNTYFNLICVNSRKRAITNWHTCVISVNVDWWMFSGCNKSDYSCSFSRKGTTDCCEYVHFEHTFGNNLSFSWFVGVSAIRSKWEPIEGIYLNLRNSWFWNHNVIKNKRQMTLLISHLAYHIHFLNMKIDIYSFIILKSHV